MTAHDLTGARPELLTTRTLGNCIWWSEEIDTVVAGWTVTYVQAKVLLCNREKKISCVLGRPMSLN